MQESALISRRNGFSEGYQEILRVIGDIPVTTSKETPISKDAFLLDDHLKIDKISLHFEKIPDTLGLNNNDDCHKGTPMRVAKMFFNEVVSGLNPKNKPEVTLFENKFEYNQKLVEKNIKVNYNRNKK